MNEKMKELCGRLETSAKESEQGRNFAGTPDNCRQAVLAISGGTLFNEKLYTENDILRRGMDEIDAILERIHAESVAVPVLTSTPPSFQSRVEPWFRACFPPSVCEDKIERTDRFIEEALELAQSGGYSRERAHALVDYVFNRLAGVPYQEIGGVMVTLAAYCIAHGHDMHDAGEQELVRINQPAVMEKIRAKQAAKPVGSALPVAYAGTPISTYGAIDMGYEPTGEAQ